MFFRSKNPPQDVVLQPYPQPPSRLRKAAVSIFLSVVVAILTTAVGMVIVNEVWTYVSNLEEFRISPQAVKIDLPPWARPALQDEIRRAVSLRGQYSIFQPGLAAKVAQEYEKSPWIKKVFYIRKEFPNRIVMELLLPKPIARVRAADRTHLIDKDCVLLPERFFCWPAEEGRLPVITVGDDVYPCPPGRKWKEESVKAGVGLTRYLQSYGVIEKLNVINIDVSNVGGRRSRELCEIVLTNGNGSKIRWGSFTPSSRPGEVPKETKLQNLLTAVKYRGSDFAGLEYVDVRWDDPYEKRLSSVSKMPRVLRW